MALYGPRSSTTENRTNWTIGLALTGRVMSPIFTMVTPLKLDRILLAELSPSKGRFICLNVGSCNRLVALPGSTNTLCTPKSLIHKVSTSASWCGTMTLDGLMGGKDMGSSIGWTILLLARAWIVFGGYAQHALLLVLRLILIVSWATQYIVDGGSRLRWEFCAGHYSLDRRCRLRYAVRLLDIPSEVACPDHFFYHKLQASTLVGLVLVVPIVVTPQRLVALCGIRLNRCGPLEFGMIPDERKEPVIRDVQRGKLRRFPLPF